MRYAMVVVFTLGGAYLGFSAARHTDLADELRKMKENPIIQVYSLEHEVESYQGLRELDFLAPEQEKIIVKLNKFCSHYETIMLSENEMLEAISLLPSVLLNEVFGKYDNLR